MVTGFSESHVVIGRKLPYVSGEGEAHTRNAYDASAADGACGAAGCLASSPSNASPLSRAGHVAAAGRAAWLHRHPSRAPCSDLAPSPLPLRRRACRLSQARSPGCAAVGVRQAERLRVGRRDRILAAAWQQRHRTDHGADGRAARRRRPAGAPLAYTRGTRPLGSSVHAGREGARQPRALPAFAADAVSTSALSRCF
eukprot:365081-Chlamydomonas_euryale.AAC.8